ncbi:MAG: type III pantothenate kinase [Bacteriovorax sp.]|nr:type III pantothenate kinase [Bacteriovorax sp.]
MRIITVDNGNTNPHVGIFQDEKLVSIIPLKDFTIQKDDFILISDVGAPLSFKPSFDLKTKRHSSNNQNLFFDMPVHYAETLGDDRLISAYFLFKQIKATETILLIDAGTFMTMDLVSEKGFLGGYIFPGINTFLSSYKLGANLSVLEPKKEPKKDFKITDLPHSTEEAILGAADCYLDSILESVIKKTSPSKIIITGGSLELINNKILKLNLSKVQIETSRHLLHSSLFLIYQNHFRSKYP